MGFEHQDQPRDGGFLFHSLGKMVGVSAARLCARIVQQMAQHVDRFFLEADVGHASLSGMAPQKGWKGCRAKF